MFGRIPLKERTEIQIFAGTVDSGSVSGVDKNGSRAAEIFFPNAEGVVFKDCVLERCYNNN